MDGQQFAQEVTRLQAIGLPPRMMQEWRARTLRELAGTEGLGVTQLLRLESILSAAPRSETVADECGLLISACQVAMQGSDPHNWSQE
jgi:hypothetical protein